MDMWVIKANVSRTLTRLEGSLLPETLATGPPPLLQLPLTITHFNVTLQGYVSQKYFNFLLNSLRLKGELEWCVLFVSNEDPDV